MNEEEAVLVRIEPMTKDEYLGTKKRLTISYSQFTIVSLGKFLVASTSKGICYLMPAEKRWLPVETLKRHFPKARFRCQKCLFIVRLLSCCGCGTAVRKKCAYMCMEPLSVSSLE